MTEVRPGVLVMYRASMRSSDAPCDHWVGDMYEPGYRAHLLLNPRQTFIWLNISTMHSAGEAVDRGVVGALGPKIVGATYHWHEDALPLVVQRKKAVLDIFASANPVGYSGSVCAPCAGMRFGSGNYWFLITEEDLKEAAMQQGP